MKKKPNYGRGPGGCLDEKIANVDLKKGPGGGLARKNGNVD